MGFLAGLAGACCKVLCKPVPSWAILKGLGALEESDDIGDIVGVFGLVAHSLSAQYGHEPPDAVSHSELVEQVDKTSEQTTPGRLMILRAKRATM